MNASNEKAGDSHIDHTAAYQAQHKAWQDVDARKTAVTMLRNVADAIEEKETATVFPAGGPEDDPFARASQRSAASQSSIDKACDIIEHGGTLDATTLASLVRYVADMMEE